MAKTKFTAIEHLAIWEVWGGKCAYTSHAIDLDSMHIDHILPESLLDNPEELEKIRRTLGLNDNFDINGYENLVPCKAAANLRKGDQILDHSRFYLSLAKDKAVQISTKVQILKNKTTGAKAKKQLSGSLEEKKLTVQEVLETSLDYVEPLREDDPKSVQLRGVLNAIQQKASSGSLDLRAFIDESTGDTPSDKEIDKLRDLITDGKCLTAKDGLQKLWTELPANTEPRIRFRIKANIGAAFLKLGDVQQAAKLHLEAYDEAPNEPKAAANKVFGLALNGQAKEGLEFAKKALDSIIDPRLSCSLYTASKLAGVAEDPTALIPASQFSDVNLCVSRIDYLRALDKIEWCELAKQALVTFPDDGDVQRFAADAIIDEIITGRGFNQTIHFPLETQKNIRYAANMLQQLWAKELKSQGRKDVTMAANLCTSYRILHESSKAIEVISEALQIEPDNAVLINCRYGIAIDSTDYETAKSLIEQVDKTRDIIVGFAQVCANSDHWEELLDFLSNTDLSVLGNEDLMFIESISLAAKFKMGQLTQPAQDIKQLLDKYSGHPLASTILFSIADGMDDQDMRHALFQGAYERVEELKPVQKSMLAKIAATLNQHSAITELLGDISTEIDSEHLRLLAQAFVNSRPSVKSVRFARTIVERFSKDNYYLRIAGSIFYNAGFLDDAQKTMLLALSQNPNDAQTHIGIVHTFLRKGRDDLAEKHISKLKVGSLIGSAYQLMGVAQLLTRYGRYKEGTELGYQTTVKNLDDPKIVQLYAGIFLLDPDPNLVPKIGDTISENCSVHVVDQDGKSQFVTIEKGQDRPASGIYSPSHRLSKALLGLKKGDTAILVGNMGASRQLKIVDFKHKYLHLFHELLSTFNTRFPSEQGLVELRIKDNDVAPVLEQVKNLSGRGQQIIDIYKKGSAPLAVVSKLDGRGSVVEFAKQLTSRGFHIIACQGSQDERQASIEALQETSGIALDTYTAWAVYELELLPILKQLFYKVAVARSVIDDLREWKEKYNSTSGPVMTLGYENGQFVRQEMSVEDIQKTAEYIQDGITTIERELEVIPAVAPGSLSPAEKEYLDLAGDTGLDAIFLCRQENLTLVTEDFKYREISDSVLKRRGAWLQSVLIWALDSKEITLDEYLSALTKLSQLGHTFITLNAYVLIKIVEIDPTLTKLSIIARNLGGESADIGSHVDVIREFIYRISSAAVDDLVKARAISILLDRAAEMGSRSKQLGMIFGRLQQINQCSGLQSLKSWMVGHFIPTE